MKLVNYFQIYLVIGTVRANQINQNLLETYAEYSSVEDNTSKFDDNNKVNSESFEVTPHRDRVKPLRGKVICPPQGITETVPELKLSKQLTMEVAEEDQKSRLELDCTNKGQTTSETVKVPVEYIEEFTSASITKGFNSTSFTTPVPNTTTIKTVTWKYQGSKSSEESDESKSTLIDYPFSVSIQRKGAHYASGALLDKRWIITVAGEFFNVRETLKLFKVRLGSVDCKRGGIVVPIKRIEIHPYYLHGKPNFDLALLRMAMSINFTSFIRPIAISEIQGKVVSAKFMTTYWARILHKGSILPQSARERVKYNSMRVSTQRLIPMDQCVEKMKSFMEILNESSLCLRPVVTHHSVCMPDAGAPVIAEDGLWGITSGWISPLCPRVSAPTIFTRLSSSSVRSWLEAQLVSL